jgi:ketosteroid isomerase-like protein
MGTDDVADANLETIRRLYEAFARVDIETIAGIVSDEVVITQTPELPWGGTFHGHAGLLEFFGTLTGTIASVVTTERMFAAGDRVVQLGRTAGTVVATGAAFDVAEVHVWTLRDGLGVRFEAYIDTPTMLEALAVDR